MPSIFKDNSFSGSHSVWKYEYTLKTRLPESVFSLKIDGINLDQVYENFVRQVLFTHEDFSSLKSLDISLKELVERIGKIQKIKKDIEKLRVKIQREKQLNRQIELNTDLRRLQNDLDKLFLPNETPQD